ncbi:hypothetical protein AA23498_2805 [Acetobacter nitrogenifigens DSM 23921 = NBRC 105050]|nr:hypothetical protein AA23498_2805 [Acetobacter nitrogenifigens DSM 23921 = NBRC 105050]
MRITAGSDNESSIDIARNPAITIKPILNDPVLSFRYPTIDGPMNPPTVPIVLIKAIPPAAALPLRNLVGIAQKIARAEFTPTRAAVSPNSAISG